VNFSSPRTPFSSSSSPPRPRARNTALHQLANESDVRCWMFDVGCWMLDVGCFPIYPTELLPHVHTRFENSKMHSDDDRNGQTRHSPISHLANPRLPGPMLENILHSSTS